MRLVCLSLLFLFCLPMVALGAPGGEAQGFDYPWWSALPFLFILLCIAFLPLVAGHFWHKNLNKFLISLALGLPVIAYLYFNNEASNHQTMHDLAHEMKEYVAFIVLLGSLYTISGGILLQGDLKGKPMTNACFLGIGSVLANFIGTTGASMLLIRPYLRMNMGRVRKAHLPIFFIFMVSNVGGLLTPLGDPPLFLGFLKGVGFFWTIELWPQWLVVNGSVLMIFLIWDTITYTKEDPIIREGHTVNPKPLGLRGKRNFLFLAGVIGAVLLKSVPQEDLPTFLQGVPFLSEGLMVLMAILSLAMTPEGLREENEYSWEPIIEVAVLFIGIFVTMVPAVQLLSLHGGEMGVSQPWQYFWLTGGLSAFLDNAPTYVTFGALAAGNPNDFSILMHTKKEILQAISCGAVFMGALTYIGNGPNFMVKAITEGMDIKMPTFFGYLAYSLLILGPIFVAVTFIFFAP